jgi:hypothetical protein
VFVVEKRLACACDSEREVDGSKIDFLFAEGSAGVLLLGLSPGNNPPPEEEVLAPWFPNNDISRE